MKITFTNFLRYDKRDDNLEYDISCVLPKYRVSVDVEPN